MPTRKPSFNMKEINGVKIHQRTSDGYIDATAMCDSCDKDFKEYMQIRFTQRFLTELSNVLEIDKSDLIQDADEDIIWIHPQAAINLAQWCSVKLAVLIPQWAFEWMNKTSTPNTEEVKTEKPLKNKFEDYDPNFGALIDKAIAFDPRKNKAPKK